MSPVHVIVGEDPRAEAMWSSAFTGAVDIYTFPRNVDAFERLTAAQAPVDLVVLTPAQSGPFNMTPDQFVARVLDGPLGAGRLLGNLHVIVVGAPLRHAHPRAMSVSTLDAAIRLVKFGEVEQAPKPASMRLPAPQQQPARPTYGSAPADDLPFAGSVISRIWDAGDEAAARNEAVAPIEHEAPARRDIAGGGPASAEPAPVALFSRAAPRGFVAASSATGGGAPAAMPAQMQPVQQAPQEAIQVASGGLQPTRPYVLPGGGAYRGPAVRGGVVNAASHDAVGGQPVPPALASQVETMVYGTGVQVGNPHDPVMVFSSTARTAAAPAPQLQPAAGAQPAAPVAHVRTVPLEPPAGAYGVQAPVPAMVDPFLARAEAAGSAVSFG